MNDVKSEYRKARRRVQSRIYRLRKKGYDTSRIKLPSIPKRVTEGSIRRLEKSFTPKKLKEKAIKLPDITPMVKPTKSSTPVEYDAPDEFDVLVDLIQSQIDDIPNKPLPNASRSVSRICSSEFNSFVNSIAEDAKEEAVDKLRGIMSDNILNYEKYTSDDISEAVSWGANLEELASTINSDALADIAAELINGELENTADDDMPWGENWKNI